MVLTGAEIYALILIAKGLVKAGIKRFQRWRRKIHDSKTEKQKRMGGPAIPKQQIDLEVKTVNFLKQIAGELLD